jgi:hypothetical protein
MLFQRMERRFQRNDKLADRDDIHRSGNSTITTGIQPLQLGGNSSARQRIVLSTVAVGWSKASKSRTHTLGARKLVYAHRVYKLRLPEAS